MNLTVEQARLLMCVTECRYTLNIVMAMGWVNRFSSLRAVENARARCRRKLNALEGDGLIVAGCPPKQMKWSTQTVRWYLSDKAAANWQEIYDLAYHQKWHG